MSELQDLFAAMAAFAPGVPGDVRPPRDGEIAPCRDNSPVLARLVREIEASYPDAGRLFPAVRAWGMVSWQPATLAVLAVHVTRAVPALDRVSVAASPCGYRYSLPSDVVQTGESDALLRLAADRLRTWIDAVFADFSGIAPVRARLVERIVADRILSTLAVLAAEGTLAPRCAEAASANWLNTLLPSRPGRPLTVCAGEKGILPSFERRACCLEFRIGAELCPNCPKLRPSERAAQTKAHWEARWHANREAHVRTR